MIIKFAQGPDLHEIASMFWDYKAQIDYQPEKILSSLKNMIAQNAVVVALVNDKIVGLAGGYFVESMFNGDYYFVAMFFFFVESHRHYAKEFLSRIEEVLAITTANKFIISSPGFKDHEKMDRFYRMNGFDLLETHYCKSIK